MSKNPSTVRLTVGGVPYRLPIDHIQSRPDTMLAKICSNSKQDDKSIEIKRDGSLFRFVLDYMRDDKVILPSNVKKEDLLLELCFYLGDNVDADKVQTKQTTKDLSQDIALLHSLSAQEIEEWKQEHDTVTKLLTHLRIARLCFTESAFLDQQGDRQVSIVDRELVGTWKECYDAALFDSLLGRFGLKTSPGFERPKSGYPTSVNIVDHRVLPARPELSRAETPSGNTITTECLQVSGVTTETREATRDPPNPEVVFDVGGVEFEVPRSLIESFPDTVLARICSETWQGHDNDHEDNSIFIDRDAARFVYVLEFMRHNMVVLPSEVPKEAFKEDLTYFGFEFDEDKILTSTVGATMNLVVTKKWRPWKIGSTKQNNNCRICDAHSFVSTSSAELRESRY